MSPRRLGTLLSVAALAAACGLDLLGRGATPSDAGNAPIVADAGRDAVADAARGADSGPDAAADAPSDAAWWLDACPVPWGCQSDPGTFLCLPSDPCPADGGSFCCGSSCVGSGTLCFGPANFCEEQPDCPAGNVCCGESTRYPPRLTCRTDCNASDFRACKMGSGECSCGLYCLDAGKPVLACGPPNRCP